ncbi:MAG TPA: SMI1/KNR4 family protein [Urbifossiella sp.]|nr:SMI1/KNR4 family protein [Urbifossiella sp.]
MTEPMRTVLERLEGWLRANRPEVLLDRPSGVSAADLTHASEKLGRSLPGDVQSLYRWQNGAPVGNWEGGPETWDPAAVFWDNFLDGWFMPLEQVVERYPPFCADRAAGRLIDQRYWWWHDGWVPIVQKQRGCLCVDTAGVWGGPVGQLIVFWNNDTERTILAPSLLDLFEARVRDLESGAVIAWSGGFCERLAWSDPDGFPKSGDVGAPPPETPALTEAEVAAGPSDLAKRASHGWTRPDARSTRRLLSSRPRWGRAHGRWYIFWSEAAPTGKLGVMTFMPDTGDLWLEAKQIMDAAACANWEAQFAPDNPHRPYVQIVY